MTKTTSSLLINSLELRVNLGWLAQERKRQQTIFLTIEVRYGHTPNACHTDNLEDTVCYDKLVSTIKEKIAKRHFSLIEKLTCDIYDLTQPLLPEKSLLKVSLLKYPNIKGLTGGVQFSYGDF